MTSQAAKLALTLLLVAIACNSHAASERPSLLQCGINIGGRTLTYQTPAETKNRQDKRMNHVQGVKREEPLHFTTAAATDATATTTQESDNRLPPKLTLAIFGCSWR
jgi:hypothetical protein